MFLFSFVSLVSFVSKLFSVPSVSKLFYVLPTIFSGRTHASNCLSLR
jgi:hypothetical protein